MILWECLNCGAVTVEGSMLCEDCDVKRKSRYML